jgi:hypothetical protein
VYQTQGRPFVVEYYYKARWGNALEFLTLFRKNHWVGREPQRTRLT